MSTSTPRDTEVTRPRAGADRGTAAHALARLARHLDHALADVGLTVPQYRLLLFLSKRPDAANRLASALHVRPPSLTALVDGMAARGLVERTTDPDDGRRVRIVITPAGTEALAEADAHAADRLDALAALDPAGRDLCAGLADWYDALQASAEQRWAR